MLLSGLLFLSAAYSICFAEEEVKSPASGPGKAVLEASKEEGIRLSEKAKATIGIKTIKVASNFQIPGTALIHERGEFGVYVKRGEWFKYIEGIEDLKKTNRIVIKVVTVRGDAGSLGDFRERLTRMPAVTIKEG